LKNSYLLFIKNTFFSFTDKLFIYFFFKYKNNSHNFFFYFFFFKKKNKKNNNYNKKSILNKTLICNLLENKDIYKNLELKKNIYFSNVLLKIKLNFINNTTIDLNNRNNSKFLSYVIKLNNIKKITNFNLNKYLKLYLFKSNLINKIKLYV
jgi:hypothetical protein